jgi:hypothetical protein
MSYPYTQQDEPNEGAKPHPRQDELDRATYALLDEFNEKLDALMSSLKERKAPYKAWATLDEAVESAQLVIQDAFPGYAEHEGGDEYSKNDRLIKGDDEDGYRHIAMGEE